MADGRDAVSVVPADRWDADEFFDPDPDAPGKMVARRAGFVDDVSGFDAPFFGVSAREAMFMDPQHRLMLETTWSAIEHAGMAPSGVGGHSDRCLHGAVHARIRGDDRPVVPVGGHRFLFGNGLFRRGGCGTNQLPAGLEGAGHDRGYGLQLVVGGTAPGLPGTRFR